MNNFAADLEFSQGASGEPFWDAIYRKAFPDMLSHTPNPKKSFAQELGIDRLILLSSGKTLTIDEKKRRDNWPDVLLEYLSNDALNKPGWMDKDLQVDYLAYALMPRQTVYLFPWPCLRRVWLENREAWLAEDSEYKKVVAKNEFYNTLSVAIPANELRNKVARAMTVTL